MTISEFILSTRVAALKAGATFEQACLPANVVCGNGVKIAIHASAKARCNPQTDEGPWHTFDVLVSGDTLHLVPDWAISKMSHPVCGWRQVGAAELVRVMRECGWPEEQLGKLRVHGDRK